jgi:hypothetical protein
MGELRDLLNTIFGFLTAFGGMAAKKGAKSAAGEISKKFTKSKKSKAGKEKKQGRFGNSFSRTKERGKDLSNYSPKSEYESRKGVTKGVGIAANAREQMIKEAMQRRKSEQKQKELKQKELLEQKNAGQSKAGQSPYRPQKLRSAGPSGLARPGGRK